MLLYFLMVIPPLLLGLYAQWRVKSTFASMSEIPARMSGGEAARRMLDAAGLNSVGIERIEGHLSDHYDPRSKVLRLSPDVYNGHTMAALGVACHEAGHAFQDAQQYAPLVIRNLAVPAANIGSGAGIWMLFGGIVLNTMGAASIGLPVAWIGVFLFAAVVFFQIINLPVEFNASTRARQHLVEYGIIAEREEQYVAKVLNAAALTYVAATLQAIMTLLYYVWILLGDRR